MTWIVTADFSVCNIYQYDKSIPKLTLLKTIEHPENRLKKEEFFTSDKPGHYKTDAAARGTYSQRTDPKEAGIEKFSKEIALELNQGRTSHAYDKLVIIMLPHMNGLLSQYLDKHVQDLVVNNIKKDVNHLPEHELLDFIKIHTRYPDKE